MKTPGFTFLALFAHFALGQQGSLGGVTPKAPRPEVQAVLEAARAAPPEFTADVVTLVETGLVEDRRVQQKLLTEAFAAAAHAQEKVSLSRLDTSATGTAFRDSLNWSVDEVSLKARVVRSMLKLDPKRGLELFESIRLPLDPKFTCEQPFFYRPVIYEEVMAGLANSIADPVELQQFLLAAAARIRSSSQVRNFAYLLRSLLETRRESATTAVFALGGRLPALDADARVFTAEFPGAILALKSLAADCPSGPRDYLVAQTRAWILRASAVGVCAQRSRQVLSMDGSLKRVDPESPIDAFNRGLAPLSSTPAPIAAEDRPQEPTGPGYEDALLSPDYQRFLRMYSLFAKEDPAAKESDRWKLEMERFISLLIDWTNPFADDQDPTEYYLEKASLLHRVLGIQTEPPKAQSPAEYLKAAKTARAHTPAALLGRDRAMVALVDWFTSGTALSVYNRRHVAWFYPVRWLLNSPENSPQIDSLLAASADAVLHLYGALGRLEAEVGRESF